MPPPKKTQSFSIPSPMSAWRPVQPQLQPPLHSLHLYQTPAINSTGLAQAISRVFSNSFPTLLSSLQPTLQGQFGRNVNIQASTMSLFRLRFELHGTLPKHRINLSNDNRHIGINKGETPLGDCVTGDFYNLHGH